MMTTERFCKSPLILRFCYRSSKAHCEESKQCYWLEKSKFEGKCIHQTERLYNALYKKLHKRGKKDIAIQVFYKSRPAKVKLPHGLYGPHIIGAFNHLHVRIFFLNL